MGDGKNYCLVSIFKVLVMEERLKAKEDLCSDLEKKSEVCVYYILRTQYVSVSLWFLCSHLKWFITEIIRFFER